MKYRRWLPFGLMFLLGGVVHAEGVCPPGMFPTNPSGAQGPVGCAPIPGYNNNEQAQPQAVPHPPPQWATRWGAIATYEPNGSFGEAIDMPSQGSAEQTALADCQAKQGATCTVQLSYRNQCAVMVVSEKGYNVNAAATIDQATENGMQTCNKSGDTNCHVYYSACSMPVRIR